MLLFDSKAGKIIATVRVNGRLLGQEPSSSVNKKLSETAEGLFLDTGLGMPGLSKQNFRVEFINLADSGGPTNFAEYENGELILH
jgi:hypothetical protein